MSFNFNVNVSESDYFNFTNFILLKSPYCKALYKMIKICVFIVVLGACIVTLLSSFNLNGVIKSIAIAITGALFVCLYPPIVKLIGKLSFKNSQKMGSALYSPSSIMTFDEEGFEETTPEAKSCFKYSSVDRISVFAKNCVYIHLNSVQAYIIPSATFESDDEFKSFIEFISSKISTVDYYK